MNDLLNVLMAEDSPDDAQLILFQLEQEGIEIEYRRVDNEAAFVAALDLPTDLILSDFAMPRFNGLQALRIVKERGLDIPFILISGTIGEEIAVEAMKLGADDYLMKDRLGRLGSAIQNALNQKYLRDEKARADLALQNSEELFRSLIENSSDEVSIISPEGLLLYESPSSVPTLGYQPGEFTGKILFQLVHPDDLERVQNQFTQLVNDPDLHPRERFRLLHQNGTWRWVEAVGTNLLHEPAVGGIVVNYHDVTERVQAEEQIQYQATLLENVSDAVVSTDVNGIIKSWNKAAESMFGFAEDAVINQLSTNVIKTEYISESNEEMYAQLHASGSWRGEVRVFHKDGTAVYSIASVSIIKDSQGDVLGYLSVNHDITERKKAEEKLRESEEQYRSLFEDSPIALWVEDFSEVKQHLDTLRESGVEDIPAYLREHPEFVIEFANYVRVVDVNSAALKLYQAREKAQLVGGLNNILPTLPLEQFEHEIAQITNGILNFEREGVDQTFTGKRIYVNLRWSVAPGYENSLSKVIVSTIDITERKQAEEQIQRQLQHLKALRAIDIAISSSFNLNITLDILLSQVIQQLKPDAAAILLFQPTTKTLEYAASRGFRSTAIREARVRLGEGYAGRAILERRVIHIPNLSTANSERAQALLLKGEGFIDYYCVPLNVKGEVKGVLEIFHRSVPARDSEWLDFLETLASQAAIAIENATLFENLQRSNRELAQAYDATIEGWSYALDLRDKETEGHTLRVTKLTMDLAQEFGFTNEKLLYIRWGALLHDIGKMGVPDSILLKPDKLTETEWESMRKHPTFAFEMLSPITYLKSAIDIPYCHHEKWDGTGYPRGLKGEGIPLAARLFAVVDVWDALTSDRPYRKGWSKEKTLEYIKEQSGKYFDPQVVRVFLKVIGSS